MIRFLALFLSFLLLSPLAVDTPVSAAAQKVSWWFYGISVQSGVSTTIDKDFLVEGTSSTQELYISFRPSSDGVFTLSFLTDYRGTPDKPYPAQIASASAFVYYGGRNVPIDIVRLSEADFGYQEGYTTYAIDCTGFSADSYEVIARIYFSTPASDTLHISAAFDFSPVEIVQPSGWFQRIITAIRSVGDYIGGILNNFWQSVSDGFSVVGQKLDALIAKLTNTEGKADADAQAQSQAQQQQDLQNGVDEINSAEKPDLSNMDLSQFTNVTANPVLTNIMAVPQVLQMMLAAATLAIFSYLLFGKKG